MVKWSDIEVRGFADSSNNRRWNLTFTSGLYPPFQSNCRSLQCMIYNHIGFLCSYIYRHKKTKIPPYDKYNTRPPFFPPSLHCRTVLYIYIYICRIIILLVQSSSSYSSAYIRLGLVRGHGMRDAKLGFDQLLRAQVAC